MSIDKRQLKLREHAQPSRHFLIREFLDEVFLQFEQEGVVYCILHSYEDVVKTGTESDIDMVFGKVQARSVREILHRVAKSKGWQIVHEHIEYEYGCFYYFFYQDELFIHLDLCTDYRRDGCVLLDNDLLLSGRQRYRNLYVPALVVELAYLLLKSILKKQLTIQHKQRIKYLYARNAKDARNLLSCLLGADLARNMEQWILCDECPENSTVSLDKMKRLVIKGVTLKNPFDGIAYWFWEIVRRIKRLVRANGVVLAIIGPDGAGKTSVANEVIAVLSRAFLRTRYFHWRPDLFPPLRQVMQREQLSAEKIDHTDPHGQRPFGSFVSILRLAYYMNDFIWGYIFKVLPEKARGSLVVFDRYYYDLLVDQIRYRFDVPTWLVWLLMKVVPTPDLVYYLHAEPEVLIQRKNELPLNELERQVRVFGSILPNLPNPRRIDAHHEFEEVVKAIVSDVIGALDERYQ